VLWDHRQPAQGKHARHGRHTVLRDAQASPAVQAGCGGALTWMQSRGMDTLGMLCTPRDSVRLLVSSHEACRAHG